MFEFNCKFLQALCIFESANAFDLKKHNHRVDMNFVKLLPFWQTFLLFLRICPDCSLVKKNSRRTPKQNRIVPFSQEKRFFIETLCFLLWKSKTALVFFPREMEFLICFPHKEMKQKCRVFCFLFLPLVEKAFFTSKRKVLRFVVFEQTCFIFPANKEMLNRWMNEQLLN